MTGVEPVLYTCLYAFQVSIWHDAVVTCYLLFHERLLKCRREVSYMGLCYEEKKTAFLSMYYRHIFGVFLCSFPHI